MNPGICAGSDLKRDKIEMNYDTAATADERDRHLPQLAKRG